MTVVCWVDINEQFRDVVYSNYSVSNVARIAA